MKKSCIPLSGQPIRLIAEDPAMKQVVTEADRLAEFDTTTVLIEGETGTGKEMIAQRIHNMSGRRDRPFIVLDCATIPQTLRESTLFGHEKGAFTGAITDHRGILEQADTGTLMLDEISSLDTSAQALLLRFLETHEVRRIGDGRPQHLDIRVIAASNRGLIPLVEKGWFRADLYHRIRVACIRIPPLRERPADITILLDYYLSYWASIHQRPRPVLDKDLRSFLIHHQWPGNVRELRNMAERMISQIPGHKVRLKDMFRILHDENPGALHATEYRQRGRLSDPCFVQNLLHVWTGTGGHVTRTAAILELPKSSVSRMIKELGLHRSAGRSLY